MIIIHVLMSHVDDFSSGFNYVADSILGGLLSASVFMVSMGVGFAYSKKQDCKTLLKRGISLFIIGYILNIIIAPYVFNQEGEKVILGEIYTYYFYGDIFQFAGLAMIFFS